MAQVDYDKKKFVRDAYGRLFSIPKKTTGCLKRGKLMFITTHKVTK